MPKKRKLPPDANEPTSVPSRVLAERAAARVTWAGADLSALLRPGEVPQRNRRALLNPEPDAWVDNNARKLLDASERIQRALPADMDPIKRQQFVDLWFGQTINNIASLQATLEREAAEQASAQQEAKITPSTQPQPLYPDNMTLKEAAAYTRVSERKLNYARSEKEGSPKRLPSLKVGRKVLLEKKELDAWLKSQRH